MHCTNSSIFQLIFTTLQANNYNFPDRLALGATCPHIECRKQVAGTKYLMWTWTLFHHSFKKYKSIYQALPGFLGVYKENRSRQSTLKKTNPCRMYSRVHQGCNKGKPRQLWHAHLPRFTLLTVKLKIHAEVRALETVCSLKHNNRCYPSSATCVKVITFTHKNTRR